MWALNFHYLWLKHDTIISDTTVNKCVLLPLLCVYFCLYYLCTYASTICVLMPLLFVYLCLYYFCMYVSTMCVLMPLLCVYVCLYYLCTYASTICVLMPLLFVYSIDLLMYSLLHNVFTYFELGCFDY